jgi:hypothetical protein
LFLSWGLILSNIEWGMSCCQRKLQPGRHHACVFDDCSSHARICWPCVR